MITKFLRSSSIMAKSFIPMYSFTTLNENENNEKDIKDPCENLLSGIKAITENKSIHNPEESVITLKSYGFSLEDFKDRTFVRLKKDLGSKELIIEFESKEQIQNFEIDHKDYGIKKSVNPNAEIAVEFNLIIKDKEGKGVICQCSAENGQLQIYTIGLYKSIEGRFDNIRKKEYDGPIFNTLEYHLKIAFMSYFESIGINDKLLIFIQKFALEKDRRLFIHTMDNIGKFIKQI